MSLTKLNTDLNNVQGLADLVKDQATTVKQTMDKAGNDIKTYINDTLTAEQDTVNTALDNRLTTAEGEIDDLQTADGQNVKVTGNQTVAGIKTFSSSPIVPIPTVSGQASPKEYVDTLITGVVLGQIPPGTPGYFLHTKDDGSAVEWADAATQEELDELAGTGRTTETVKGNADNLTNHSDDNAVHVPHLGTTTNISNDYSVTSAKVIADGSKFSVKFNAVASGTATLNISSDGTARTLKKPDGTDFKPKAGIYSFIRDGANFQLLGEGGEYGTAGAAQTLSGYTVGTDNGLVNGTLTIGSLGGTRFATGVNATVVRFQSGATWYYSVTIRGLPFRPKRVTAWNNYGFGTINSDKTSYAKGDSSNLSTKTYTADSSDLTIHTTYSDGFRCLIWATTNTDDYTSYLGTWAAYED